MRTNAETHEASLRRVAADLRSVPKISDSQSSGHCRAKRERQAVRLGCCRWRCNKSVAAVDKGRTERPVFESPSVAVRRTKSISETFRPIPSPRRQPVRSRKRVKAIAGGQISPFFSALRRAAPMVAYSSSLNRRKRCCLQSVRRHAPGCPAASGGARHTRRSSQVSPPFGWQCPLPPRTLAKPRRLLVLLRAAVLPSATSCMNASTSFRVTAGHATWCRAAA